MEFTPDGIHAEDVTLLWVLHEAYAVTNADLMSGGPSWIDERRFDIDAKYDAELHPNITPEQRRLMLQQLLAERFKLVVHHEAKEFPLYALVVAKGGIKFTETSPDKLHMSPMYGAMCMNKRSRTGILEMSGCTLGQLANRISGLARRDLDRGIVDQTGLTGRYELAVKWTPISTAASDVPKSAAPDTDEAPSIFTALKEQLGLELKPIKGPLDTIVIDHAEMPTEN
jgi:uncharacterized protein (TIGR03435 family)